MIGDCVCVCVYPHQWTIVHLMTVRASLCQCRQQGHFMRVLSAHVSACVSVHVGGGCGDSCTGLNPMTTWPPPFIKGQSLFFPEDHIMTCQRPAQIFPFTSDDTCKQLHACTTERLTNCSQVDTNNQELLFTNRDRLGTLCCSVSLSGAAIGPPTVLVSKVKVEHHCRNKNTCI